MKIELEMENKTKENASIGRLIVIFFSLFQSIFFSAKGVPATDDWRSDLLVINEGASTCNRLMPPPGIFSQSPPFCYLLDFQVWYQTNTRSTDKQIIISQENNKSRII